MFSIDLNCDLGEGCPNDAELMSLISSANIACGFHAGDEATMRRTVELAIENGVAIGAHPGYYDRENFGRTNISLTSAEIADLIKRQYDALRSVCISAGCNIRHIKPHGALYNQSARDPLLARAIADAVASLDRKLILYGLSGSHSIEQAKSVGLRTASEVFADRTYQPDGSLTPRTEPNALITNDQQTASQVLQMVTSQSVSTVNGGDVSILAETVCIHGDGEHAVAFAKRVRETLIAGNITIRAT